VFTAHRIGSGCVEALVVRVTAHPRYPALAIVEVVREEKVRADGTGRYGRRESPLVAGRH
jgi:hypothetical protein